MSEIDAQAQAGRPDWPVKLEFQTSAKTLHIGFEDGAVFDIPYELLRVESPSAEVQGHGPSQKKLVPGKVDVGVESAERVGRYAVRLTFDDGHDSGIFSWRYLRALGEDAEALMQAYAARLDAAGLSRRSAPARP